MSNWNTYRLVLEGVLNSLNYTEQPEIRTDADTSMTKRDRVYLLKPTGLTQETTDGGTLGVYTVEVEITYTNQTSAERHLNFIDFDTVVDNIVAQPDFKGMTEQPTFVDADKMTTIGRMVFLFGIRTC